MRKKKENDDSSEKRVRRGRERNKRQKGRETNGNHALYNILRCTTQTIIEPLIVDAIWWRTSKYCLPEALY